MKRADRKMPGTRWYILFQKAFYSAFFFLFLERIRCSVVSCSLEWSVLMKTVLMWLWYFILDPAFTSQDFGPFLYLLFFPQNTSDWNFKFTKKYIYIHLFQNPTNVNGIFIYYYFICRIKTLTFQSWCHSGSSTHHNRSWPPTWQQ